MPKRAKRKQKSRVVDVSPHIFTCEDKDFTRDPHENHPFSARPDAIIGLFSRPGGGKSSIVKNFLCHGGYRKVFVAHGAGDHSKEYELVDYEPVSFDTHGPDYYVEQSKECGGAPMVLVCDDLAYADFGKIARANMYKIAQFVCTHYRMTLVCTAHSWPQLVPRIRRLCTVYCLWKPSADQIPYMARGLACSRESLARAFAKCTGKYDFVLIERDPPPGRAEWRLNGHVPFDPS